MWIWGKLGWEGHAKKGTVFVTVDNKLTTLTLVLQSACKDADLFYLLKRFRSPSLPPATPTLTNETSDWKSDKNSMLAHG